MNRKRIPVAVALFIATFLIAAAPGVSGSGPEVVKGEVIAVGPGRPAADGMVERGITVRTRAGDEQRLRLREQADCSGCLQIGDRVRARLHAASGNGEARHVQSMRVNRQGSQWRFHDGERGWRSVGSGAGDRQRERLHASANPRAGGGGGAMARTGHRGRG